MAKRYKVWLELEEWDEETDESTNLDVGFASEAVFDTEEEARAYVDKVHAESPNAGLGDAI